MTAGPRRLAERLWRRAAVVIALSGLALAAAFFLVPYGEGPPVGPTVEQKVSALRAERAGLQARADGAGRIDLLPAFRTASLLIDALSVRVQAIQDRSFETLPAFWLRAFAEADKLNLALGDALDRPGQGSRRAALAAADRAAAQLARLANDGLPVVLAYTPRFVPPRSASGELTLSPGAPATAPSERALPMASQPAPPLERPPAPAVPRYAPDFASARDGQDPPLHIEIVGGHLTGGDPPVLAIGGWRGRAAVGPERLRFVVPRSVFGADARRTTFAVGTLSVRRGSHTDSFQLLFTVLPDRLGSFALDQRVRTTVQEANTLVSPEILSRAPAGETRTVRRCFDPPPGWRFDKDKLRVVIVERLGWKDDISDPTLNSGSVDFVPADSPAQVCVAVVAQPVMKTARTATIGRFEATLLRDVPSEKVVKSGVRALDWREPVRLRIEPGMVEWKLYIRLFGDVDREFTGRADTAMPRTDTGFLRISREDDGAVVVLQADPEAEP